MCKLILVTGVVTLLAFRRIAPRSQVKSALSWLPGSSQAAKSHRNTLSSLLLELLISLFLGFFLLFLCFFESQGFSFSLFLLTLFLLILDFSLEGLDEHHLFGDGLFLGELCLVELLVALSEIFQLIL